MSHVKRLYFPHVRLDNLLSCGNGFLFPVSFCAKQNMFFAKFCQAKYMFSPLDRRRVCAVFQLCQALLQKHKI